MRTPAPFFSRSLTIPCICLLVFMSSLLLHAADTLKTESFDRDPDWEGHNNRIIPKEYPTITQEFGYSKTGVAGKAEGELGGRVHRASQPAFYAAKIAPKTLNDKLSASGTFALTKSASNGGVFFGWFNSRQVPGTGRPMNSFGMSMDCEASGSRLQLYVITAQNQVSGTFITRYERYRSEEDRKEKRPSPIKPDGTRYTWKLDYDPAAAEGKGQFQFMVKSNSGQPQDFEGKPFTVDLPAGFKDQGTSFDRFGLMNLTRAGSPVTIYFDDVALDGRAQDFARDPGPSWEGSGNRTTYTAKEVGGAQDFGFRETNRAGGKAGELGGITWRGPYAYYADSVGPFSLNDRLEARGRIFFEGAGLDAGVNIGWFNSAVKEVDDKNPAKAGNFVGVNIGGHTRVGHWFLPYCLTSKGERNFNDQGSLPLLKAGTAYEWTFLYDPAANAGNGQMKVTLGGASATLDLRPAVKAQGAQMDRFGISSGGTGGGEVKFSLDDLQYTAAKP
jgi:hypothetical protein